MSVEQRYRNRLAELGLVLGPVPEPRGAYLPASADDQRLWLSGVTGRSAVGPATQGVVGEEVSVEQARESARQAAVNLVAAVLSTPVAERASGVLFLRGYVRAAASFEVHPAVVDAASEVLEHVLGGHGHAPRRVGGRREVGGRS